MTTFRSKDSGMYVAHANIVKTNGKLGMVYSMAKDRMTAITDLLTYLMK